MRKKMPISKKEVTKRLRIADIDSRWSELTTIEKQEAKIQIGNFLVDKINQFLDSSTSPVSGGAFKKKKATGASSQLFEKGDMRSAITFTEFRDGVEVGVFDDSQAPKAFNHNTGDTLPTRQFIPTEDQNFKRVINTGMKDIISQLLGESNGN
jgi:hypothetical protein